MSACIMFVGCLGIGNYQVNDIHPDWKGIRNDSPQYQGRDKSNSGNCFDYAVAAYNELLRRGYNKDRLKFQACKIGNEDHMVCIVDGHKVYSIYEQWVLEKDSLDWEWVGVEMD